MSARAGHADHRQRRLEQNAHIEIERPAIDLLHVEANPVLERR